jgi:two-component system sensor histidine kinase BaeS
MPLNRTPSILENAIRFGVMDGQELVGVSRDDDRCCIRVTDQGEGIDPDILPQAFQGFVHANLTHRSVGQGLSLALAQQIVLAPHGTIEVGSAKGLGTTVIVWLPVAAADDC